MRKPVVSTADDMSVIESDGRRAGDRGEGRSSIYCYVK